MKNIFLALMLVAAGLIIGQPQTAFGQDNKSSAKSNPPKLVRYTMPPKNKRKKTKLRRKVDLSKVPRVIKVIKRP